MRYVDLDGTVVESPDLAANRVEVRVARVTHRWVEESPEEGHWETVAEYPSGGRDVEWAVDREAVGRWETVGEDGEPSELWDGEDAEWWERGADVPDECEYGVLVPYTEEELAEIEGRRVSALARSQLPALAAMVLPSMTPSMSLSEVASVSALLPEWRVGAKYAKGEAFTYEGKVYRAAQGIPEAQDIYRPGTGTESLYTLIDLAPDGIRVWHMPTDATDSFALGERCHYPDADGPVYVSGRDGNTSEPTKDEWWEEAA